MDKETSQNVWDQLCAFFEVMLDDFSSKNLLRRNISELDREKLDLVWENSRIYENALRDMLHRFEGKPETFAQKCSNIGFSEQTVNCLFISHLIGTYLIELEAVFRASLLFFLQEGCYNTEKGMINIDKKMALGNLLKEINKISPSFEKEIYSLIKGNFRNCFSHGTFWFHKGGRIFLAKNSYLEGVKEISLGKLWMQCLEMSLVANALVDTLKKKEDQGYFKS